MVYHIDKNGRLSKEDMEDAPCTLIIFTTTQAPASITVINWRELYDWRPSWTGYVQSPETMQAYRLLAGSMPSAFFQLRILVTQFQRQNTTAGPFILPVVGHLQRFTSIRLERMLRQLSEREQVALLNSMRLSQFVP